MMPGREHFPGPFRGRLDYGDYGMHHAGHPLVAWIFLILFALLVGVAIFALIKVARRQPGATAPAIPAVSPADPALQELRARYARGDMGREEFLQRSADLGYANPAVAIPPPPPAEHT